MTKRLDIKIGNIYHDWTILEVYSGPRTTVLVQCRCGKIKTNYASSVVLGKTKKCMSCAAKSRNKNRRSEGTTLTQNMVYSDYKAKCKKQNIKFEISYENFIWYTQQKCYYCNTEPRSIKKHSQSKWAQPYIYNGLDRIEPVRGYVDDNVVSCCGTCNRMKSDMSAQNFVQHIKSITKNILEKRE